MPEELLPMPRVEARVGYKRSWIYQQIKLGKFPKPLNLGLGKNLWSSEAIDQYIEALKKQAAEEC